MALPKAAKKQLAEAEKLHAEIYAEEEKPVLTEVPTDEPSESPTAPTAPKAEEAAPPEETVPELRPEAGQDQGNAGAENWEHKYSVLKGKYDAEVPRLQQANNALSGRVDEMSAQMNQLMAEQAKPADPIEPGQYLNAEEIDDYGEDMIAVVKKAAREEFEPAMASLQQENAQLRGLLGGMQQQTVQSARQTMLDTLDGEVANWRELNSQPEFIGWLENLDPYSGQKKLDMLRAAFEGNNAPRVLAFFRGYLNENAAFTAGNGPSTAGQDPQVSLDTLVAPGRPSDGNDTRAQEGNTKKIWTQQEIGSFYNDVNRGVYRLRPEKKAELEADIFDAQLTGRIT